VALAYQEYTHTVWAATVETDTSERRAVSKSDNGGETWTVVLPGIFAHNFAFNDSIVYVAADEGVLVSADGGENWYTLPEIRDAQTGEGIFTNIFYSAGVSRENTDRRVWVGSKDGLASTVDNGNHWTVHRSYRSTQLSSAPDVYAYPNPFLRGQHDCIRFQYDISQAGEVKIDIYDFAMDKVAEIREFETAPTADDSKDRSAVWFGQTGSGRNVANGVYFFRAKIEGKVTWGKLVVIN